MRRLAQGAGFTLAAGGTGAGCQPVIWRPFSAIASRRIVRERNARVQCRTVIGKRNSSKLLQRRHFQPAALLPWLGLAGHDSTSTLARLGTPSAGAVCRAASAKRAGFTLRRQSGAVRLRISVRNFSARTGSIAAK